MKKKLEKENEYQKDMVLPIEMDKLVAIAYPIPINLIVGGVRRLWLWCMYGHKLYEDGYVKVIMRAIEAEIML